MRRVKRVLRKKPEMFTFWILISFVFKSATSYVEIVEEAAFENTTMRLTCRHFDSIIVIHNATFMPVSNVNKNDYEEGLVEVRRALNHRCSGVSHCSFIVNQDSPIASRWGSGNLSVTYACISDTEIKKYCNQDITLPDNDNPGSSEAYVHSPGYPKFYLGQERCTWRITAPHYQRIKVTILDLSLFGNTENCNDQLLIKDSGQTIYSSCNQNQSLTQMTSVSDSIEIILSSTEILTPRRGVLFHYAPVGCKPLNIPNNGYLVSKNESVTIFGCCADFTFSDTNQKTKVIKCIGYKWDFILPLPSCDNKRLITDIQEYSSRKISHQSNMQELIAPIVLIALLFTINAIILFIIFQYRKRKNSSPVCNEEELKTFSVTSPGSLA
nr:uncharacterized protein LOC111416538 [Onthophagus taurus]